MYINYSISTSSCSDPWENKDSTKNYSIDGLVINEEFELLIMKAISNLKESSESSKSKQYHGHSGFRNKVSLSDSTVVIYEYSDNNWTSFDDLKVLITESEINLKNTGDINGAWKGFSGSFIDSLWSYSCYTPNRMNYYKKGEYYRYDDISLTIMNDSFYFYSGQISHKKNPIHYNFIEGT